MSTAQTPTLFTPTTVPTLVLKTYYHPPTFHDVMRLNTQLATARYQHMFKTLKSAGLKDISVEYSGCGDSGQIDDFSLTFHDPETDAKAARASKFDYTDVTKETQEIDIRDIKLDDDIRKTMDVRITPKIPDPRPQGWTYPTYDRAALLEKIKTDLAWVDFEIFNVTVSVYRFTTTNYTKPLEEILDEFFYTMIEANHSGYEINDGGGGNITLCLETASVTYESYEYFTERTDNTIEVDLGVQ